MRMDVSSSSCSRGFAFAKRFRLDGRALLRPASVRRAGEAGSRRLRMQCDAEPRCALRIPESELARDSARSASSSTRRGEPADSSRSERNRLNSAKCCGIPTPQPAPWPRSFPRRLACAAQPVPRRAAIEGDAVLAAIDFERGKVQHILILSNLGVQLVNALVQAVLLAFLLLNRVWRAAFPRRSALRAASRCARLRRPARALCQPAFGARSPRIWSRISE